MDVFSFAVVGLIFPGVSDHKGVDQMCLSPSLKEQASKKQNKFSYGLRLMHKFT